jgi:hypothetical protein
MVAMVTMMTMAEATAGLSTTGWGGTRGPGTTRLMRTTAETTLRSTAGALRETTGDSTGGLSTRGGSSILLVAKLRQNVEYEAIREDKWILAGLTTYQVESNGIGSQSQSGSQAEDNVELHGEDVCVCEIK